VELRLAQTEHTTRGFRGHSLTTTSIFNMKAEGCFFFFFFFYVYMYTQKKKRGAGPDNRI